MGLALMERRVSFSLCTCINFCPFDQEGGSWVRAPRRSAGVPITHALIFSIILANHSLALKNWQLIIKLCFCRIQILKLFSLLRTDNFHYLVCQSFSKCFSNTALCQEQKTYFLPLWSQVLRYILSKRMREVLCVAHSGWTPCLLVRVATWTDHSG